MRVGSVRRVRLLLLARHGQSVFNVSGVVNGDPALDRGLTDAGRAAAEGLARELAGIPIGLCVTSRFPRAQETARLALGSRAAEVPHVVDPDLDDIRIGGPGPDTRRLPGVEARAHPGRPFSGG